MPSKPPNAVRIEHEAERHICLAGITAADSAINKKQICRSTKSKATGLAVSKAAATAFESGGNDFAHSRCVTTGPIMLLIKYPTSQ